MSRVKTGLPPPSSYLPGIFPEVSVHRGSSSSGVFLLLPPDPPDLPHDL